MRTLIQFGSAIKNHVSKYLPAFKHYKDIPTPEYLIFLFHRVQEDGWNAFLLVQGSRYVGRFNIETAICRRNDYPYFYASARPFIAVDGVRERLNKLIYGADGWWEYRSPEEFSKKITEAFWLAERGLAYLVENNQKVLEREIQFWIPSFREWKLDNQENIDKPLGERFQKLKLEKETYDYITFMLDKTPISPFETLAFKKEFNSDHWLSFLTFIMTKILEMKDLEALLNQDVKGTVVKNDEMGVILKRIPDSVKVVDEEENKINTLGYAFTKAEAVAEAFLCV
ncbi:MAG: hypothetical protein M1536_00460 [Firmicutes bacterium]|nr:hypothetical protein [Bacillota bacterium]